jgi:biopolymer transport protein ExbB
MSNPKTSSGSSNSLFAVIVIPVLAIISILLYMFVLGAGSHYEGGDPVKGHPLDLLGTIHKGGIIVPILFTINLTVIVFSIERFITLIKAGGSGSTDAFVRKVKAHLTGGQIDSAIGECDKQKGSLANVVRAGFTKYKLVANDASMDKDGKVAAIQKDLEEATSLELPMLSKNLVILSTCASISTLIGLIGTVVGMIRSFAALANAGAPDTTALATGISEALINTLFGIMGSAIAIIMYNYFSNRIDAMTYGMDEASYSISQTFAEKAH